MELQIFLENLMKVSLGSQAKDYKAKKAFKTTLSWIVNTNYRGGCHDTSAALYMLLFEQGLNPELCIGEVQITENKFFDHSWVSVDGMILDASICMPNIREYTFPPVFASKELFKLGAPEVRYGASSPVGFDSSAKFVSSVNLQEYSSGHQDNPNKLWNLTKTLAKEAGIKVNTGKLKSRYGGLTRTIAGKQPI
ncbi:lasso peptide biosynthesis protein [Stutzerimonas kunmingensis]|uniref:lasso peptide biosynthesis protein n=1 Tax=Stutzerimonas kunmingensis TaxID=1211807 RepID=UPI00241E52AB|nr:lasso peptide biosynthesis protein [Stutzerimonas kunmingensis]